MDCGGYEQVTEHMLKVIKGNLLFAKDIMRLMNLAVYNVLSQGRRKLMVNRKTMNITEIHLSYGCHVVVLGA